LGCQATKKEGTMSEDKRKYKTNPWKEKLKACKKELKRTNKRLEEMTNSRDGWKEQYKQLQEEQKTKGSNSRLGSGVHPRGHHYDLNTLILALHLIRYGGMSPRGCVHSLRCMYESLGIKDRVPSHVSIRNWMLKQGYCMLQYVKEKTKAGTWAVIVDESITVGKQRLLVVLGLELGAWKFDRGVSLEDVVVLHMSRREEWKGPAVKAVLEEACQGRKVTHGTCDGGRNLLNAFDLWGMIQNPDCTHRIANILKKHLKINVDFIDMNAQITTYRREWKLGKKAPWRPPAVRGQSRFLNIFVLFDWIEKIIKTEKELPAEVKEACQWIFQKLCFFQALIELRKITTQVLEILKIQGAQQAPLAKVEQLLAGQEHPLLKAIFGGIKEYIEELKENSKDDPAPKICCSDIIETLFGKFKYRLKDSSKITDLALSIPFYCGKLNAENLVKGFGEVTYKQVKTWNELKGKT
jgi:hypothetical protein